MPVLHQPKKRKFKHHSSPVYTNRDVEIYARRTDDPVQHQRYVEIYPREVPPTEGFSRRATVASSPMMPSMRQMPVVANNMIERRSTVATILQDPRIKCKYCSEPSCSGVHIAQKPQMVPIESNFMQKQAAPWTAGQQCRQCYRDDCPGVNGRSKCLACPRCFEYSGCGYEKRRGRTSCGASEVDVSVNYEKMLQRRV